ncbi:TonB-dependent receptor [Frateuria defendens]|uniref:TonB-dependent receptor n=1 Tax=Frateuria defendens TaxID=2219559 RepID=UPI00066FCAEB|nr:TonB-dependent receptor [Frateuria defendens]
MATTKQLIRRGLALAISIGLSGTALAQSTTGTVFGQVAAGQGDSVQIKSNTGLTRTVSLDERGRYSAAQLPVGTYTVVLQRNGQAVETRDDVVVKLGAGTDVSFAPAETKTLGGVSVNASALPSVDVSSVDSRTVVTADQLARLPLGRSAEAIALLAPGVINNGGSYTGATGNSLVSFSGSAASENAYYINGFATTDPLQGLGGLSLPYGAIDQQEVYTGGYSAMYGRSDGGVINVVGKRGTNEWHFGAQLLWEPAFARAAQRDRYFRNGLAGIASPVPGNEYLYSPDSQDHVWTTTASAYAGGPLIKDKLFFFVAGEFERQEGNTVNPTINFNSNKPYVGYRYGDPRWYAKLDWNITDNHILELTGASDKHETNGSIYNYNYATQTRLGFSRYDNRTKAGGDLYALKYTGYLTDSLTVTALYGKMKTNNYNQPVGYDSSLTYVTNTGFQNPALNGGSERRNSQIASLTSANRSNKTNNYRLDISYVLGDHTITLGIDNQNAKAIDQGAFTSGPGYSWEYGYTKDPFVDISTGLGVGAPGNYPNGASGYYVIQNVAYSLATVRSSQRAQYIEDKWQVSDRLLLSLGLRNDQFTNYNSDGDAFIRQRTPQWAPRLGFSWDVNGDASFKVYGNAGRYYLGLPLNPALNAAGGALNTQQYFTYSGIAADGSPTGLTAFSNPVAANNTFGQLPDPKTVTTQGLKSEYQDEFILGFTKTAGANWVYGAKLTQRILRNAIDDYCYLSEGDRVQAKAASLGYDVTFESPAEGVPASNPVSCWLINPGKANTFTLVDTSGNYRSVSLNREEFGFPRLKRRYYGLETFLEHPFDGTWYGKLTYVFSRSYGNTEGQLRSDLYATGRASGQTATSTTQDWDNSFIMEHTNGVQNNDRKHQIKFFGYYQFTPEWLASANLSVASGAPRQCLGAYGPNATDPAGYTNSYHFCDGQPSPPGSHGRLPWIRQLDLGVTYRPTFAAGKLGLSANVFNVLNEQRMTAAYPYSVTRGTTPNPLYGTAAAYQAPRYVRLSVSYDY